MKYSIDYFKSIFDYKDIYELPEAVKVHVLSSGSGREYDFYIKFVWEYGVGFPESYAAGCSWCSVYVGSVMTMPDGTELIMGDPGEFIGEVFNWFDRRDCRKVKLTDGEVEFMDI